MNSHSPVEGSTAISSMLFTQQGIYACCNQQDKCWHNSKQKFDRPFRWISDVRLTIDQPANQVDNACKG